MNGLELVEKAFRLEELERAPWVPFVGVHGAHLIGVNAESYLKDASSITAGIEKAIGLYRPDGIPVVFDLQIEAEILGCKLAWSKENPPAVVSHPLTEGLELLGLKLPEAYRWPYSDSTRSNPFRERKTPGTGSLRFNYRAFYLGAALTGDRDFYEVI